MILTKYRGVVGTNVPREEFQFDDFGGLANFIAGVSAPADLSAKGKIKLNLPGVVFARMTGDRKNSAVDAIHAVPFDYDGEHNNQTDSYASNFSPEWAANILRDEVIRHFIYTTPGDCCSYDEKTKQLIPSQQRKWRVICPLAKPIKRADFDSLPDFLAAYEKIVARLYGLLEGRGDGCVFTPSQAYFVGNLIGQKSCEFLSGDGRCIDERPDLPEIYKNKATKPEVVFERPKIDVFASRLDAHQLKEVMRDAINGDAVSWDDWNKVGMTIYNTTAGSEYGFAAFDEWSRQSKKYAAQEVKNRWRHWANSPADYLGADNINRVLDEVAKTVKASEKAVANQNKKYPIRRADYEGDEPPHDFVEDLLHEGGFSIVYGGSNVGKTFWCLALAQAIASGNKFLGLKDCDQGSVLYIAAEGGGTIWNRLKAMTLDGQDTGNLYMLAAPVDLFDANEDTEPLAREIADLCAKMPVPLSLIIFDTMQKIAPGLNENDSGDTGVLMSNLDKIRDAMPNPVARLVVHHTGKDATKGMRGSSALFAAADTGVELKKVADGFGIATATKQRDLDAGAFTDIGYRLQPVPLGINKRGKPYGSCVVRPCDMHVKDNAQKLNDGERRLNQIVNDVFSNFDRPARPQTWRKSGGQITVKNSVHKSEVFEWFRTSADTSGQNPDTIRKAFARAINGLQNKGLLVFHDDFLGQPDNAGQLPDNF